MRPLLEVDELVGRWRYQLLRDFAGQSRCGNSVSGFGMLDARAMQPNGSCCFLPKGTRSGAGVGMPPAVDA
jgi:hypothetical protein